MGPLLAFLLWIMNPMHPNWVYETYMNASNISSYEKIEYINKVVNSRIRYQTDWQNYGIGEYWATPIETISRGVGDCEDYAILKMYIISTVAPEWKTSIELSKSKFQTGIYHAVLRVTDGTNDFVLDYSHNNVLQYTKFVEEYEQTGNIPSTIITGR